MLNIRSFREEDLKSIKVQKEQESEFSDPASFLSADVAATVFDEKEIVCCIGIKEIEGRQCVAAYISSEIGIRIIELVRIFYNLRLQVLRPGAYFLVKKDFKNANKLAKILGFKKSKDKPIDKKLKNYYIYEIGE